MVRISKADEVPWRRTMRSSNADVRRFRHFSRPYAAAVAGRPTALSRESRRLVLLMAAGEAQKESEERRGGEALMADRVRKEPPCQPLSPQTARSLAESVDAFLFDCDGVIWKGDKLIEGVSEALQALRSMGKKLVFVTNNSRKSRKQYAKKFAAFGLDVSEDEIFSSSFAAAMFLKLKNFPKDKKVYVVGEEGILEELELAGFTCLGGPEDGKKNIQLKSNLWFEHDKSVGAVVVGLDQHINFYKLQYATLCIRENPGCLFIATNRDAVGHFTDLQEWPGAGCMVAAICGSTQREPIVVGKPSTFVMDFLLERFQFDTSKMCMVGDRLDTDILFGQNAGCKTLLVLSGVTTLLELQSPSNSIHPDYYARSVFDVIELLRT
ncbi:phosphoglycolate phosphatase 2 [Phoenix dactylifera]|uniref:phosphoglycolate phosphatase n=1 Tax=Phoenix dactylifera TaxID=42345 RepID=A0A8B7BQ16_PHODC|nr:phosphoglycolate phosphatase 2 [Phoenix dactylifera]